MCLNEILRCVVSTKIGEERNKNVTKSPNMFSTRGVEVLADLGKERVQEQSCARSFQSVYFSVFRNGAFANVYMPCLKNYVEKGNFIGDRPKL